MVSVGALQAWPVADLLMTNEHSMSASCTAVQHIPTTGTIWLVSDCYFTVAGPQRCLQGGLTMKR
jgi:hypothetical protein